MDTTYTNIPPPLIPSDTQNTYGQFNDDVKVFGDLAVSGDFDVDGSINFDGDLVVSSTTPSTNITTGALTVAGGVGVAGQLYASTIVVSSTTASTNITSGALTVAGGAGVAGQLYASTVVGLNLVSSGKSNLGSTSSSLLAFYGVAGATQARTTISTGTWIGSATGSVGILDTFGGYTIGQVVTALKNIGILS